MEGATHSHSIDLCYETVADQTYQALWREVGRTVESKAHWVYPQEAHLTSTAFPPTRLWESNARYKSNHVVALWAIPQWAVNPRRASSGYALSADCDPPDQE